MFRVLVVFALVGCSAGIRRSHWNAMNMDAARDGDTELVQERHAQGWRRNVGSHGKGNASSLKMSQSNMSVRNVNGDRLMDIRARSDSGRNFTAGSRIGDLLQKGTQLLSTAHEHVEDAQQAMSTLQAKIDKQHAEPFAELPTMIDKACGHNWKEWAFENGVGQVSSTVIAYLEKYIGMISKQQVAVESAKNSILDARAPIPVEKQDADEGDMIQEIKAAEWIRIKQIDRALGQMHDALEKWVQLGGDAQDCIDNAVKQMKECPGWDNTQNFLTIVRLNLLSGFAVTMTKLLKQAKDSLQTARNARHEADLSQVTTSTTANPSSKCEHRSESGIFEIMCQCDDMYNVFEQTLPATTGASFSHGYSLAAMLQFMDSVLIPSAPNYVDVAGGVTSVCGNNFASLRGQNELTTFVLNTWEGVKAILESERARIANIAKSLQDARARIQSNLAARTEMQALEEAQKLDKKRMEVLETSQKLLQEAREAWKTPGQGQAKIEGELRIMISNVQTCAGSYYTQTATVIKQLSELLTEVETLDMRYDAAYSATVIEFG